MNTIYLTEAAIAQAVAQLLPLLGCEDEAELNVDNIIRPHGYHVLCIPRDEDVPNVVPDPVLAWERYSCAWRWLTREEVGGLPPVPPEPQAALSTPDWVAYRQGKAPRPRPLPSGMKE